MRAVGTSDGSHGPVPRVSSADTFTGGLRDDLPHGFGTYTWADGSRYEGDWDEGVRTGRGVYVWPSASRYEGEWLAGRMHGQGSFTSPDGTRYEGGWLNDLKHGLGTLRRQICPVTPTRLATV
jgi:1-phosphatidylinositol-4-phosphate 5-kinase